MMKKRHAPQSFSDTYTNVCVAVAGRNIHDSIYNWLNLISSSTAILPTVQPKSYNHCACTFVDRCDFNDFIFLSLLACFVTELTTV